MQICHQESQTTQKNMQVWPCMACQCSTQTTYKATEVIYHNIERCVHGPVVWSITTHAMVTSLCTVLYAVMAPVQPVAPSCSLLLHRHAMQSQICIFSLFSDIRFFFFFFFYEVICGVVFKALDMSFPIHHACLGVTPRYFDLF